MSKRVYGLEGMRGIAAFWVYTHHFILIFFPAFYFGPHSWINHVFNPDLAVSWFFVHSGYVLAFKGRHLEGEAYKLTLIDQSLRRYFRLIPPVVFSILLTYLVMKLELNFNHDLKSTWMNSYLNFKPDFFEAMKQSFFGVYFDFKSNTTYNPNLWTIGFELISSYILFACLGLFGHLKNSVWIFFFLGLIISPWKGLMCFMMGAFLTRLPPHRAHWGFLVLLTVTGFYFSDLKGPYEDYARNLGAGLLMYALLQSPNFRKILTWWPIQRLGEMSYSLYVLHFLVLVSFTSYFALRWQVANSHALILGLYLLTSLVLLIISYFTWILVDRPGIEIARRFSSLLMRKPTSRAIP